MSRSAKTTLGAVGIIAVVTMASRFFGFARKLAQSWAMADGSVATLYDTANTVPNVLFEIVAGGALAGAVIPLLSGYLARDEKAKLAQLASALFTWIVTVGLPISLLVVCFAPQIMGALLGATADPAMTQLGATLLRLFALQVPLYGVSVVFSGILQSYERFLLPALSPLLSSLVLILVFAGYANVFEYDLPAYSLSTGGILLLGLGTTMGVVIFSLPQTIPVMRLLPLRLTFKFPDQSGKQAFRLAVAGLGALIAQQCAILIVMHFANTQGGMGAFAIFNYAFAIFMVPYGVLAVPIATVMFPKVSRAVAMGDVVKRNHYIAVSTRLVTIMGVLSASLIFALAKPAAIIFAVGRQLAGLDLLLEVIAFSVLGYCMLYHGGRILYALAQAKRVVIVNTLAWSLVALFLLFVPLLITVTDRYAALTVIGLAFGLGMTVGAIAVCCMIYQAVGRSALAGIGRDFALFLCVLGALALGIGYVNSWLLPQMENGIFWAVILLLIESGLLLGVALGIIWVGKRDLWQSLGKANKN